MKSICPLIMFSIVVLVGFLFPTSSFAVDQATQASAEVPSAQLIQPEELVKLLNTPDSHKMLIIQVGFRRLYDQAHIPNSEYIGPASNVNGLQQLRARVEHTEKSAPIVLYCGCCPWNHCPNVKPAYAALRDLGFTNVKVLYIADNFGTNWVDKGYPTEGSR